jgi:hypothetical protein
MTGDVGVVGAVEAVYLQIVPTIVDVDLTSNKFTEGSSFEILGSGFTEGDLSVRFGATEVVDTGTSGYPDVFDDYYMGAGLNRADNDGISLQVPAGAATGLITVETAGGTSAALPISLTQVEGTALAGTPASGVQPSANPGQTVRIVGQGFDLTTEVIFPTIDINGNLSNRAVLPDLVNGDGTFMEVRAPDDAITGNLRVVGAPGTFPLQIVPTLTLVKRFSGSQVRMLGGGFTENTGLSVDFSGVTVSDTGSNIDVRGWFLSNDTLRVDQPSGSGDTVTVTTAGARVRRWRLLWTIRRPCRRSMAWPCSLRRPVRTRAGWWRRTDRATCRCWKPGRWPRCGRSIGRGHPPAPSAWIFSGHPWTCRTRCEVW